jgi:hypothetical protein
MTRIEKARQLGVSFVLAPNVSIEDGIEAVRSTMNKLWFDKKKCEPLLKALENYRQEWDAKRKIYKSQPLHDYSNLKEDSHEQNIQNHKEVCPAKNDILVLAIQVYCTRLA